VGRESDVEGERIDPVRENRSEAGWTASALLPGWYAEEGGAPGSSGSEEGG
jgi:hypothetical protein